MLNTSRNQNNGYNVHVATMMTNACGIMGSEYVDACEGKRPNPFAGYAVDAVVADKTEALAMWELAQE